MILDNFKLSQLIVQIQYPHALELWDSAGAANRRLQKIWPDVEIVGDQITPNQVILKSGHVQIDTGLDKSTISLSRLTTIDQNSIQKITETFQAWRGSGFSDFAPMTAVLSFG